MDYHIHTDGGARGNPGPAAIGVVIRRSDGQTNTIAKTIGTATNNIAEYEAVIIALEWFVKNSIVSDSIHVFLDSQLIARQLKGLYRIKNYALSQKFLKVKSLEKVLKSHITYNEIPRSENTQADSLVNYALNNNSR